MDGEHAGVDAADRTSEFGGSVGDTARLAAVASTGLLDAAPEESLEQLARLAAGVLGVANVFVTLVDEQRSCRLAATGVTPDSATGGYGSVAVEDSFCQYVIADDAPVIIADARLDPRSSDNRTVRSAAVTAWAGFPLRSVDGSVLGTFCAADPAPRAWSLDDLTLLDALATAATSHLQLRAALTAATASATTLAAELALREEIVARATLLAQLASELGAAHTVDKVAAVITTTGRDVLGAAFANVALVDREQRHLLIMDTPGSPSLLAHRDPRVPLGHDAPLAHAVLRQETVLLSNDRVIAAQYPDLVGAGTADDARPKAMASIPLFRADRTVAGALAVGWATPMEFTSMMRSLLATVSEMCAQALDRSQVGDARTQFVRSLQYALLPATIGRQGLDISAEYIAANDALGFGGDWYDVVHLTPTRTALVVGDVCGHGIEAAARMTQVRGSINALVMLHGQHPGRLFGLAERHLSLARPDFVATLSVHIIDVETDTVTYVSAGHPPALLVSEAGDATLLEAGRRPVLGLGGPDPEPGVAPFAPGSTLVAFTDGLVEQGRRPLDQGLATLTRTVTESRRHTARAITSAIAATIMVNAPDDIAYTVVRRADEPPFASCD